MIEAHTRRTEAILRECGALLENDHFVYVNGDHGSGWVDKDLLNTQPRLVAELGQMLSQEIADWDAEWVCGPAIGGILVAQWVSFYLDRPMVFAEHAPTTEGELRGAFFLGRGYGEHLENRRVVVVDDVVNSGHSICQTIDAVQRVGARVVGVAAYVDRDNLGGAPFPDVAYRFLCRVKLPSWPEAECPDEILARPVNTRYAHGSDYLAKKRGTVL